jgi:hypothetical protein
MITHEGFIFISPDGHYLIRHNYLGDAPGGKDSMQLTPNLSAATLFSTDRLPSKGDWTSVVARMNRIDINANWEDLDEIMIALPAKSVQSIQITKGDKR